MPHAALLRVLSSDFYLLTSVFQLLSLEGGQFCPQPAFSRLWPPKRRLRPRLAALQIQTGPTTQGSHVSI